MMLAGHETEAYWRAMKRNIGIAAIALSWIAIPAFGAQYLFAPNSVVHRLTGSGHVEHHVAVTAAGSLGRDRETELLRATRSYVEQHPDAPADMADGKALAPVDYLNDRLAEHGAKWRVRAVHGLNAEIYEVS